MSKVTKPVVKNVLLVTATIAPKAGTPNISRTDPQQRLNDYLMGFKFYLERLGDTFDHLVFCENSNSDVSPLRKLAQEKGLEDRVTFYVKDGLDYPPHFDRAYGEFKLIDDAMGIVPALQGESKVIWKVSGRYTVLNVRSIVQRAKPPFDLACNYRNRPKHWVDTYLIGWTPTAYKRFLVGVYDRLKTNVPEVQTGLSGEELLRTYLESNPEIRVSKRFATTPDVHGVRAADNQHYHDRFNYKYQIRRMMRVFVPWVWI
jgi:hypothetical protein